ncbi:leucine-rich melanocyte differentiation-associated protein-like isoform X2 [Lineus longissimus]
MNVDVKAPKRFSLAYQNVTEIPEKVMKTYGGTLEELDLTHNSFSDFRFLMDLPCLTTLILDHNHIESHVKFPSLQSLHTLWMNHNDIANLGVIIKTLSTYFPNLRYLSLMNNPAAPSYFNGGTLIQYTDYRQYLISQLPKLEALDDQPISKDDRREAERIYGKAVPADKEVVEKKVTDRKASVARESKTSRRRSSALNDGVSLIKPKSRKSRAKLFDDD